MGEYEFDRSFAKQIDRAVGYNNNKEDLKLFVKSKTWHNAIRQRLLNNICTFCSSRISELGIGEGTALTSEDNLLFSHYSAGHTGFCIEFKGLVDHFGTGNNGRDGFEQVCYQMECPTVDFSKPEELCLVEILNSFKIKQTSWNYEREWRLSVDRTTISDTPKFNSSHQITNNGVLLYLPEGSISSIIIGCKSSSENQLKIMEIAEEKSISVYKAVEHETQYALVLQKVN